MYWLGLRCRLRCRVGLRLGLWLSLRCRLRVGFRLRVRCWLRLSCGFQGRRHRRPRGLGRSWGGLSDDERARDRFDSRDASHDGKDFVTCSFIRDTAAYFGDPVLDDDFFELPAQPLLKEGQPNLFLELACATDPQLKLAVDSLDFGDRERGLDDEDLIPSAVNPADDGDDTVLRLHAQGFVALAREDLQHGFLKPNILLVRLVQLRLRVREPGQQR